MLEVLGWLVLVAGGVYGIFFWFAVLFNCSGQYNIGGVANSILTRLFSWALLIPLTLYWHWLIFTAAPFTLIAK